MFIPEKIPTFTTADWPHSYKGRVHNQITIQFLNVTTERLDVGVFTSPGALVAVVEAQREGLGGEGAGGGQ